MLERRNKILTVTLSILVLIAAGILVLSREEPKPVVDRDYFKLSDSEKIDRVSLASGARTIELKFENNKWRVNDKWDADLQLVKVLFATLRQAEPGRPVAASQKDSVLSMLNKRGVHVRLSEGSDTKESFIACGNLLKTEAWFVKEGDSTPYVMVIPGYKVYVSGIFELDESGWRSKRIFDFNWRNFKSLVCRYPKDPAQGFEIGRKLGAFGIKNMVATDTAKLNTYLDGISLLFATRFVPRNAIADSLRKLAPSVSIEISDIADHKYSLELFTPRKNDADVYGRLADGEIVVMERAGVGQLVRKRDYFVARGGQ